MNGFLNIETIITNSIISGIIEDFYHLFQGVEHASIVCKECEEYPLRGIRWNCLNCDDSDLCSSCYMSNKHDDSHTFSRFESEDSKG